MTSKFSSEEAALAAEFALGVLEGEERAQAQRLSLANPAFATRVARWQRRLDPLGQAFAESPPPDVWPLIEAQLDAEARSGEIRTLRFWQVAAGASGALAAGLAALMILGPARMQQNSAPVAAASPGPVVIARLAGTGGILLAANIDPQSRYLSIRAVSLPETPLSPELWVIPGDGVPRSLGLIARGGTTQVRLPENLRPLLVDGALLAVSLETAADAPHTAPSSTPIATGKISAI